MDLKQVIEKNEKSIESLINSFEKEFSKKEDELGVYLAIMMWNDGDDYMVADFSSRDYMNGFCDGSGNDYELNTPLASYFDCDVDYIEKELEKILRAFKAGFYGNSKRKVNDDDVKELFKVVKKYFGSMEVWVDGKESTFAEEIYKVINKEN